MFDTIGERKERRRYIRNRIIPFILCCFFLIGCTAYLLGLDPAKSSKPTDIVQGTGNDINEFDLVHTTLDELEVEWDEMFGQAWSIAYVSGWVRNTSARSVKIENVIYRVQDEEGSVIWEKYDNRFLQGFTLNPIEYFDFYVMPVCTRPAQTFEVIVE